MGEGRSRSSPDMDGSTAKLVATRIVPTVCTAGRRTMSGAARRMCTMVSGDSRQLRNMLRWLHGEAYPRCSGFYAADDLRIIDH